MLVVTYLSGGVVARVGVVTAVTTVTLYLLLTDHDAVARPRAAIASNAAASNAVSNAISRSGNAVGIRGSALDLTNKGDARHKDDEFKRLKQEPDVVGEKRTTHARALEEAMPVPSGTQDVQETPDGRFHAVKAETHHSQTRVKTDLVEVTENSAHPPGETQAPLNCSKQQNSSDPDSTLDSKSGHSASAGSPVEPFGSPVDPLGFPVDPGGSLVEPLGSPVDPLGFPVEPSGSPVEPDGFPVEPARSLYHTPGLELYMHSAHYDFRFNQTNVRAFGIESRHGVSRNFTCRWTSRDGNVSLFREVPARKIRIDPEWPEITSHYAVEIDCALPPGGGRVRRVAVGPRGEDLSVELPVKVKPEVTPKVNRKKTIAVCVKPVTGRVDVEKLVEWFELFRLIGMEDFIIYDADVMGRARFVFDYYVTLGVLRLVSFPFILALLDHIDGPKMRGVDRYGVYQQSFLVAMQDCFYRYRHRFEYLLFVDLDEVLLPSADVSIQTLARSVHRENPDAAAFMFLTAWHFEELSHNSTSSHNTTASDSSPRNAPYMLSHPWATHPMDVQPKSIVYPPHTVTVNFHGAHDVPDVKHANVRIAVSRDTGYIHHFRGTCVAKFDEKACRKMTSWARLDEALLRYGEKVRQRMRTALDVLQMNDRLKY